MPYGTCRTVSEMISRSHPYDLIGGTQKMRRDQQMSSNVHTNFQDKKIKDEVFRAVLMGTKSCTKILNFSTRLVVLSRVLLMAYSSTQHTHSLSTAFHTLLNILIA